VYTMKTISSKTTIENLRECFARFGLPVTIVSDNGSQFTSEEFQQFCKNNGIKHITSAPFFPASNGQAERYVQTIKTGLIKCCEGKDLDSSLRSKLNNFLMHYRKAPHAVTGESPCTLLMKRNIRTRIDLMLPNVEEKVKTIQMGTVQRHFKREKLFEVNDKVLFRVFNKKDRWNSGVVKQKIGSCMYNIKCNNDNVVTRHANQMKNCNISFKDCEPIPLTIDRSDETCDTSITKDNDTEPSFKNIVHSTPIQEKSNKNVDITNQNFHSPIARPFRNRRPPTRFSP
jgi:hypothetical protein